MKNEIVLPNKLYVRSNEIYYQIYYPYNIILGFLKEENGDFHIRNIRSFEHYQCTDVSFKDFLLK